MSHEIEIRDGQASMFYTGETPWHGLGTALPEAPTVEEAIKLAGLDWEVQLHPLYMKMEGDLIRVPDAYSTVRDIDRSVLGVVGPTYKPLQNRDAFKFFQPFLDSGAAKLETAGSLRGGKRVWILAGTNVETLEVVPGDAVTCKVLLSNSHDGTMAIRAGFTPQRVVCANTLAAAHDSEASKLLRIRHTASALSALELVQKVMDISNREFVASVEQYRALATRGVTVESLKEYVRKVFEPKLTVKDEDEQKDERERLMGKIIPLFESGRGNDLPGVKGTFWGAYNAVTEFLTWERGRSADIRLDNLWHGDGARVNQKALGTALKMAFA
jgi:phage/plasmid-like protein (TIGR03299 family)